jgi:hypothetical protein
MKQKPLEQVGGQHPKTNLQKHVIITLTVCYTSGDFLCHNRKIHMDVASMLG